MLCKPTICGADVLHLQQTLNLDLRNFMVKTRRRTLVLGLCLQLLDPSKPFNFRFFLPCLCDMGKLISTAYVMLQGNHQPVMANVNKVTNVKRWQAEAKAQVSDRWLLTNEIPSAISISVVNCYQRQQGTWNRKNDRTYHNQNQARVIYPV